MAPIGGGGTKDEDAKNMFDRIGQQVHDQVKTESNGFKDELKGNLQYAKGSGELASSNETCTLVEEYYKHPNGGGNRYPCRKSGEDVKRFSDKRGAQCDKKKIKDSDSNGDACAPFRRLNLCNKNMEKIATSMTTHKLLAEVCMAAYYEGDSIKTHYTPHQVTYSDSAAELCTVLARSFADIGDIVRGKDLFYGNKQEKEKRDELETNLKKIFEKIHNNLNNPKAKTHYEDKDPEKNFFKLREDWWTANRATVWEALTCKADDSNRYFRPTCGGGKTPTQGKCRCNDNQVPTYFDYVPQYLRWFEEWAEDFCRKRKHKLKDAIDKCRGTDSSGNDKYCSGNGYDCEKTKRGRNIYRWDYKCTGCFLSCSRFVNWIDNQRKQFDKQKNKYADEITRGGSTSRKKRDASNNYEGYEKKFYKELRKKDDNVETFLEKLSNEGICKSELKVGNETADAADFTNVNTGKTFYRTTYCEACPLCGVQKKNNGSGGNTEWEKKDDMNQCPHINLYKPKGDEVGTTINFLYSGEGKEEIKQKIDDFCAKTQNGSDGGSGGSNSNSKELYQDWQ
ncbi:hypothetical protein PFAG_02234, partial [Plasmodium falciparum Santa Lucia]